jgi:hypothetical protein
MPGRHVFSSSGSGYANPRLLLDYLKEKKIDYTSSPSGRASSRVGRVYSFRYLGRDCALALKPRGKVILRVSCRQKACTYEVFRTLESKLWAITPEGRMKLYPTD